MARTTNRLRSSALMMTMLACPFAVQTAQARPLAQHFSSNNSCYERVYTAQHLARHPRQRVQMIRLEDFPTRYGFHGPDGKIRFNPDNPELYLLLTVRFRNEMREYSAGAFCNPEGDRYVCGIECDGGGFELKDRSATSILLVNPDRFALSDCDAGNYREVSSTSDDRLFRLDRLPDAACLPPAAGTSGGN